MNISPQTKNILKNFSQINDNFIFIPGSILFTMSPAGNMIGKAVVKESFPVEACVVDLGHWLAVMTMMGDRVTDIYFDSNQFTFTNDRGFSTLNYSAKNVIKMKHPKSMDINVSPFVTFDLSQKDIDDVIKSASIMGIEDFYFISDGKKISTCVKSAKNSSSDTLTLDTGTGMGTTFSYHFSVADLKLFNGNYKVGLYKVGKVFAARFQCVSVVDATLEYHLSAKDTTTVEA